MATLRERFRALNWYLMEAKLPFVAKEIESWLNAAIAGAGAAMPTGIALLGECDIVTNLEPDGIVTKADPGANRQAPGITRPGLHQGFPEF